MSVKTIIKRAAVVCVIGLLILFGTITVRDYLKYVDGKTWFSMQYTYINDFADYADEVDTVMALYQCGTLNSEDFLTNVSVLRAELDIMQKAYNDAKEKYPVRAGTHTYTTKKGCEAVESLFTIYDTILRQMVDYADSPIQLNYYYLASRQAVTKALADYRAARDIIDGVWDEDMPSETESEMAG